MFLPKHTSKTSGAMTGCWDTLRFQASPSHFSIQLPLREGEVKDFPNTYSNPCSEWLILVVRCYGNSNGVRRFPHGSTRLFKSSKWIRSYRFNLEHCNNRADLFHPSVTYCQFAGSLVSHRISFKPLLPVLFLPC